MQTANNNNNYLDDVNVVHQKVLRGFRYVSDQRQYDKIEDWRIPEDLDGHVTGDCDDFAIACRSLLREKGHEPRLLFCLTENGGGHLICVLGKMALDNRQRSPIEIETLANRIGYKFISISGTTPGDPWRTILSSSKKTKKEEKIIIIKEEEEDNKKNDDDIWNTLESM